MNLKYYHYIINVKLKNKYKQWSNNSDRKFLNSNYLQMNNATLAANLERTEDSIRKELAKLGLKRPKKSDYPKLHVKRGRKKKVLSVFDSIQEGLHERKKGERFIVKEKEVKRRIANEALWASGFVNDDESIEKCREYLNPVIIRVPTARAEFTIDSNLPDKKIKSRIAAISKRYGVENTIVPK